MGEFTDLGDGIYMQFESNRLTIRATIGEEVELSACFPLGFVELHWPILLEEQKQPNELFVATIRVFAGYLRLITVLQLAMMPAVHVAPETWTEMQRRLMEGLKIIKADLENIAEALGRPIRFEDGIH
jgi:hypothetical protein